jgi:hypothetical protein
MKWLHIIVLTALGTTAAEMVRAAEQPFVGRWADGGIATCADPFEFTARTYSPPMSDKKGKIRKIERDGKFIGIELTDGYRITLFDVKKNTMTWHSPESGDTFELRRCR